MQGQATYFHDIMSLFALPNCSAFGQGNVKVGTKQSSKERQSELWSEQGALKGRPSYGRGFGLERTGIVDEQQDRLKECPYYGRGISVRYTCSPKMNDKGIVLLKA